MAKKYEIGYINMRGSQSYRYFYGTLNEINGWFPDCNYIRDVKEEVIKDEREDL